MSDTNHPDNAPALFRGEAVQLPLDLYIPPDALEIWLDQYEGPLDLLLFLIRKNHFDILDIPIANITAQYMEYVHYLEKTRFELASEYLVMAAWLAEIKSHILLPASPQNNEEEEVDPRLELMHRLQIYTQYKLTAEKLNQLPRMHRDAFPTEVLLPKIEHKIEMPTVDLNQLIEAMQNILKRAKLKKSYHITRETISIHDRMDSIVAQLAQAKNLEFNALFDMDEGRYGITISFLAILELTRNQIITLQQENSYGNIVLSYIE